MPAFAQAPAEAPGASNGVPVTTAAARKQDVRSALYAAIEPGVRGEKTGLAQVLGASGDAGSVAHLDKLSHDADDAVAQEGLRALRSLKARLGA